MKDKRIDYYTKRILDSRQYIDKCLKQREIWEKNPTNYRYSDINDAQLRDAAMVSYQNIGLGISSVLFANVEGICQSDESKLSVVLGLPEDEPFKPFIDAYLEGL